jgi:hypothetical protein
MVKHSINAYHIAWHYQSVYILVQREVLRTRTQILEIVHCGVTIIVFNQMLLLVFMENVINIP